jgi:hypothetical protein
MFEMSKTPFNLPREIGLVLITICASVIILPGLIFVVGSQIFGAYDGGIAAMYQATLQDFLELRLAAWIIVLSPGLCVLLLRIIFRFTTADPAPESEPVRRTRREPTLNH